MLTELKQECKKFEEIPTMPVEVMERAGNSLKHVTKSKPLKKKDVVGKTVFCALVRVENVRKMELDITFIASPASWMEDQPSMMERQDGYTRGKQHLDAPRLREEENSL